MPEIDIFGDIEIWKRQRLLVNERDAHFLRRMRRRDLRWGAIDENLTGVGMMYPAEDFQKRGFSGAVFTEQSVNFSRAQLKIDVAELAVDLNIADEQAVVMEEKRIVPPSAASQRVEHFRPDPRVTLPIFFHSLGLDAEQKAMSFHRASSLQPRPITRYHSRRMRQ